MKEQITVAEAALLYGCTHTNMSYLIATGRIPSTRKGRFIMLNRADVVALREQRDVRERSNEWIEGVKHGAA